jgi:predicted amidohydrolase YtcJ
MSTLIVGARIHGAESRNTSILFDPSGIQWVGSDDAARGVDSKVLIDGHGMVLTPGFVDAHVHATNTGLMMIGLDLTDTTSAHDLLARVGHAASRHPGEPILGHGWDETRWLVRDLPTPVELDAAAAGHLAYLSRVDVHSALVSRALIAAEPDIQRLIGFTSGSALVSQHAHGAARRTALGSITPGLRNRAQRTFLDEASRRGIVAVHEMAGPTISGESDARELLRVASDQPGPQVFLYWGELASAGGIDRARGLGAVGAGGDLFLDGALGSRTAALHEPYTDDPRNRGALYVEFEDMVDHVVQCTFAGVQAGFHVIGDRACDLATEAFRMGAEQTGITEMRRLRHRLEHAEMVNQGSLATLTELGVALSMQPLFDGLWSSPGGMYEQRLGRERARTMNRWGSALRGGATVAFSSDCPVTAMSPWAQVRAAMQHHDPDERISEDDAVDAHSRAGWWAIGDDVAGVIKPSRPAHLALWERGDAHHDPTCVATWVNGVCSYVRDGVM